MFFLLRAAFWLSLVVLLIPADPTETPRNGAARPVSPFEAIGAAQSTFQDLKGFCGREPTACDTGKAALDGFGAKARTGARWVYDQLDGRDRDATGSTPPVVAPSQPMVPPAPASPRERAAIVPMPTPRPLS